MIFPTFLFVCIFLVYLGLYQYDRCIAEQNLRYTLVREKELSYTSEKEREQIVQEMLERIFDEQGVLATIGELTCEVDYGKVKLTYIGEMPAPLLGISENQLESIWSLQVCGETEIWKPVEFIRLCNKLKGK